MISLFKGEFSPSLIFTNHFNFGSARKKPRNPDYSTWDKRAQFYAYEAASLWVEEEPTSRTAEMSKKAKNVFRKLKKDWYMKIKNPGKIEEHLEEVGEKVPETFNVGRNELFHTHTTMWRSTLENYADLIHVRPKFLSPTERP